MTSEVNVGAIKWNSDTDRHQAEDHAREERHAEVDPPSMRSPRRAKLGSRSDTRSRSLPGAEAISTTCDCALKHIPSARQASAEWSRQWRDSRNRPKAAGPSTIRSSAPSRCPTRTRSAPEFYELEREAIFKRAWLNVGRVEQLPRKGSYFTKELEVANTSIIVVRDTRRRGAGVPQHLPAPRQQAGVERHAARGDQRHLPAVHLQVPRLALRPRRRLTFVQQEGEFFDLDKSRLRAGARCTATSGRASSSSTSRREPEQIAARLPRADDHRARGLSVRPDDVAVLLPRPRSRRTGSSSWTRSRSSTTHPSCTRTSRRRSTPRPPRRPGFEAPHYHIDGPHRLVSTSGIRAWEMDAEMRKPMEDICQSGLFGPWDKPDLGRDARRAQSRRNAIRGAWIRSSCSRTS